MRAARVQVVEAKLDLDQPRALVEAHGEVQVALARATFAPDVWLPLGRALAPRTLVLTAQEEPPPGADLTVRYAVPSSGAKRVISAYARG